MRIADIDRLDVSVEKNHIKPAQAGIPADLVAGGDASGQQLARASSLGQGPEIQCPSAVLIHVVAAVGIGKHDELRGVLDPYGPDFGGIRLGVPGLQGKGAHIFRVRPAGVASVIRAAVVPQAGPARGRAEIGMLVFPAGQGREIGLEVIDPEAVADSAGFRRVGQDHGRGNLAALVRGVGQDRLGHGAEVGGAPSGLGGADGLPQTGKSKGSQQSQPRQNHQQLH